MRIIQQKLMILPLKITIFCDRRMAAEAAGLPQQTMVQMLRSLNCWLLWAGVAALSGGGQVFKMMDSVLK